MNWVSQKHSYTAKLFFNYRCSLFPHKMCISLNLHHSTSLFTSDLYQCFLPTYSALPGSPRKFTGCSWPSAATALLGASAATNVTTDIRAGPARWEPWTWQQNKGHLWSPLIRTACTEPPYCGCISPQSHLRAVGLDELWGLSQPEQFSDSMKRHSSHTTQTQSTQALLILCMGGVICIYCDHLTKKAFGGFKCKI